MSCVRREVLPSMAMRIRADPATARQSSCSKQRPNRIGSIRLTSARSQRSQGMPCETARIVAGDRDGVCPRRRCRRNRRKRRWWRRSATAGPRQRIHNPPRLAVILELGKVSLFSKSRAIGAPEPAAVASKISPDSRGGSTVHCSRRASSYHTGLSTFSGGRACSNSSSSSANTANTDFII